MSMSKMFAVATVFSAVDRMTTPLNRIADNLDKTAQKADGFGRTLAQIGRVGVQAITAVGTVAVGAGAAIFGLAKGAQEAADSIADTAGAIGISNSALQEYRYLAKLSGMETTDMDNALTKLTVNLGKGGGEVERSISAMGLSIEQLRAAGPDQVLELIAGNFNNLQDPAAKAAAVTALFGKSSIRMVNALSGGADAISALRQEARDAGYVMDDLSVASGQRLGDAFDRLELTTKGLANSIGVQFMPGLENAVNQVSELAKRGGSGIAGAFGGISDVIFGTFTTILPVIEQVMGLITPLLGLVSGVLKGIMPIITMLSKTIGRIIPFIEALVELIGEILAPAFEILAEVLEPVFEILSIIFDTLTPIIKGLTSFFKTAIAIFNGLPGPVKALLAVFMPFIGIPLLIKDAWGNISNFFTDFFTSIQRLAEPLMAVVNNVGAGFKALFAGDFSGAADAFKAAWQSVGDFISKLWGTIQMVFMNTFGSMISFLLDGVIAIGKTLGQDVTGAQRLQQNIARSQTDAKVAAGVLDAGRVQEARENKVSVGGIAVPAAVAQNFAAYRQQQTGTAPTAPAAPVSSNTTTTNRSVLDVNFNNPPAGTAMRMNGRAPGFNVNMGAAATRGAR